MALSSGTTWPRITLRGGQGESREKDEEAAYEPRRHPGGPAPSAPACLGLWRPERRGAAEGEAGEDEASIFQARLADLDRYTGGIDLLARIDPFDFELPQEA
jgi:hypothetical protein